MKKVIPPHLRPPILRARFVHFSMLILFVSFSFLRFVPAYLPPLNSRVEYRLVLHLCEGCYAIFCRLYPMLLVREKPPTETMPYDKL